MSDRTPSPAMEPVPGAPPMTPIRTSIRGLPQTAPTSKPKRSSFSLRRSSSTSSPSGSALISSAGAGFTTVFEEGSYAWLTDPEEVVIPVKIFQSFSKGERGTVVRLRPNESSFHNEEETNRKKRLSIGSRQRHHLRPSLTTIQLTPEESEKLIRADDTSLVPTSNMIEMVDLSEATLLHNLRLRFFEKAVYTSIGSILVSVNPFEALPLYTPDVVDRYKQAGSHLNRSKIGPHVYALAHDAFANMIEHRRDQSCIVTGESGSGKTELTKLFLQYLMELSKAEDDGDSARSIAEETQKDLERLRDIAADEEMGIDQHVEQDDDVNFKDLSLSTRILTANPLLEAFGNASTKRNDNSSRHGKWISVAFHKKKGSVLGANVQVYLLEKSRLVYRGTGERNFHVFYQLLAGAASDSFLRESLQLNGGLESFKYLSSDEDLENKRKTSSANNGTNPIPKAPNDARSWAETLRSLRSLGTSREEEGQLLQVLAGLLHLGNAEFVEKAEDGSSAITNRDVLEVASELLGLDSTELDSSLTRKDVSNVKERIFQNRSAAQARDARDAVAKFIYGKLFDWVVSRIAVALGPSQENFGIPHSTIGMLDVFGFEVFDRNSFEQLCINYANEKLQEQFNRQVFEMEREEYLVQGMAKVEVDALFSHVSNAQCLQMFEERPNGIFAALEDEIFIPRGTDAGFVSKLAKSYSGLDCFVKIDNLKFKVLHYAGEVEYDATSFLDKSRDKIDPVLESLVSKSSSPLLKQITSSIGGSNNTGKNTTPPSSGSSKKKEQKTLGMKFVSQLSDLLDALDMTEAHYARCIKPNDLKAPGVFKAHMVMSQLRYAGLLDVCRVRKRGFPVRLDFEEFAWRYGNTLLSSSQLPPQPSLKAKCQAILEASGVDSQNGFVGTSKILLRHSCYDALELKRDEALKQRATTIQRLARGRLSRISIEEMKSALTKLAQLSANPNFSHDHMKELEAQLAAVRDVPTTHPIVAAALLLKKRFEGRGLVLDMISKVTSIQEAILAKNEALAIGIKEDDPCLAVVNQLLAKKTELSQLKMEIEKAMESRDLVLLEKALKEFELLEGGGAGSQMSLAERLRTPSLTQETILDARTLRDRLKKEQEVVDAVEAAMGDNQTIDTLKQALKGMIQLGMEKHPTAVAGAKLLKKKKRKDNESKDLTMLRAKGSEDMKQALSKLKMAESAKDLKALAEARHEAIEMGLDRAPDVQRAARLIQQLEDENDLETSLAAATEFVWAKAKLKNGTALSFQDIERLAEAISVARQRGVSHQSSQFAQAVEVETKCRSQLKIQNGLEDALKERDYKRVNALLAEAADMSLDNDLVRRARAVVSRRNQATSGSGDNGARITRTVSLQDRALEIRRMSQKDFEKRRMERLRDARDPKNDWWNLGKKDILRADEDFAARKGTFLSVGVDRKLARAKWRYSGKVIPKSLTTKCGNDERIAKRAILMNKAVLGYCGDLILPFPSVLAQQILEAALLDPPLADELWIQILRQLTENSYEDSERRAWMLCAICASCLGPTSAEVEDAVMYFLLGQSALDNTSIDPVNREYARYALRQFEKIVLEGPSGAIPTHEEIYAFQERPPMLATVNLPDGRELIREYPVAPDITVHDLVEACCATYNIRTDLAYLFGLFVEVKSQDVTDRRTRTLKRLEVAQSLESSASPVHLLPAPPPGRPPSASSSTTTTTTPGTTGSEGKSTKTVSFQLDDNKGGSSMYRRVSSSMMSMKNPFSKDDPNTIGSPIKTSKTKTLTSASSFGGGVLGKRTSKSLSSSASFGGTSAIINEELRPDDDSDSGQVKPTFMGNRKVSAFSIVPSKSKLKHSQMPEKVPEPVPATEFLGDVFSQHIGRNERLQFIFRRKIINLAGQEPPGAMKEKPFIEICFLEAVEEFMAGTWACTTKEDVAELASLALTEARGGKPPVVVSQSQTNTIQEFIPLPWRPKLANAEWVKLVIAAGGKTKVTSGKEIRKAFLNRIERLPTYGMICFPVRRGAEEFIMGCGPKGLHLLQCNTARSEAAFYPHIRIRKIGAFSESVCIDVWDEQHSKVKERLSFVTSQGHEIAALLWEIGVKFS